MNIESGKIHGFSRISRVLAPKIRVNPWNPWTVEPVQKQSTFVTGSIYIRKGRRSGALAPVEKHERPVSRLAPAARADFAGCFPLGVMDGGGIIPYYLTMFGFLIKKTFFDLWDNLFRIALLNLGFIASLAAPVFLPGLFSHPAPAAAVLIAGVLWCSVYLSAAALSVKAISDYGSFGFADFWNKLKAGWPAGLCLGGVVLLLWAMASIIIPFYLSINSIIGLLLAAVIFWTMTLGILSLQFFFAVRARLDVKLVKVFKKCFIIFFDNPGFAVLSLLHNAAALALSALLAFLFPGPAGLLLFLDEALRLRLLKYDWLEANPDPEPRSRRRPIPWDAILIEEREKTGTRSLKSFIFPWKD
jgi:hypothetical protein